MPKAKDTPSMAKNKIRRSLVAILDPYPSASETEALWRHFGGCCAYCGKSIERASRTGHLDHVVSAAAGGSNGIHNHVLACASCNGDEKRQEEWRSFLSRKAESPHAALERGERIEAWLAQAKPSEVSPEVRRQAEAIIAEAVASYEQAVARVRALRRVGA